MSADPPPPRAQPSDGPTNPAATRKRCQVIPADGEPPCTEDGGEPYVAKGETAKPERGENRILCPTHDNERQRLYFKYKSAAADTNKQDLDITKNPNLQKPPQVLSADQVEEAIAMREKFASLIDDELAARESHRKRFVAQVDFGHTKWLRQRQRMRDTNKDALTKLCQRRGQLVATQEDARKREDEATQRRQKEATRIREARDAQARAEEAALWRRNQEAVRKSEAERNRREIAAREQLVEKERRQRERRQRAEQEEIQREFEEANARRAHATTHETRPLLDAGQPSELSTLYPQVPRAARVEPYGSRASPRGVDIERQSTAVLPEIEAEPCLAIGVFDVCFVLGLGVAVFFIFVKLVG